MTETERERVLGECLEEYHRRRAMGEGITADHWRDRLGKDFEEFREILAAASAIDDLTEPAPPVETLPRPFGEYTLLRLLGRGAMGMVYEAVHRGLGRKVALKVLRSGFEDDPLAFERFRREARACAQVRHDHIVPIFEAGQVEGRPFYAMPVIEGKSLLQLIRDGELPPPEVLCRGLADVADALETMHRAGIVHRDVKPANIMVEPSGRMILADFGLARSEVTQTLTATGQALGTPLYMSPEQLLGRKDDIDGRSDVYGLGVTLYEALAGRPPFRADDVSQLMRMILTSRPRPLPAVVPDAPLEASFVAMKAMEKRRADRYATAAAMRKDLLAFAEGRKVEGRPVSHLRYSFRRFRGRLLAIAAVLVLGAAGALWYANRPALLTLRSFPVAKVSIDGGPSAETPLVDRRLTAGMHELRFTQEGFEEVRRMLRLGAGEKRTIETLLIADRPEDPAALRRLGEELGIALQDFDKAERTRGGAEGEPLQVLYPRGDVRIADLRLWRVDVPDERMEIDGTIDFRRGDEVLASLPFDAEYTWTIAAVPAGVRDAVRAGDTVTWGYCPKAGAPVTAEFRVVADPLADRLRKLDARLADQPPLTVAHLRTQLFLDRGLYQAAWNEAAQILKQAPESEWGRGALLAAVEGMDLAATELRAEAMNGKVRGPR